MKIAVVCVTYNRPRQLGQMIRCFQRQDYAPRELVILDDAGQYASNEGPGWRLTSIAERFPTLGEKRNAAARLVSPDAAALAVWDDDDLYMPWALRASAAALELRPGRAPAWCCTHSPTARCNSTGPAACFTPAGPTAATCSTGPADTRTSTTAKIRGWPSDSVGWESPSPILWRSDFRRFWSIAGRAACTCRGPDREDTPIGADWLSSPPPSSPAIRRCDWRNQTFCPE